MAFLTLLCILGSISDSKQRWLEAPTPRLPLTSLNVLLFLCADGFYSRIPDNTRVTTLTTSSFTLPFASVRIALFSCVWVSSFGTIST